MHYIKIISLLLVASMGLSCSQIPEQSETSNDTETGNANNNITTNDIEKYKSALYAMKANNYTKAEILFRDIMQRYPQLAGPHANLGIIYFIQKKNVKAINELKIALKLNPRNAYAHNTIALSLQNQGEFTKAEKHFLLAINNKKDYAIAEYNIALLYDIFFHKINKSITHYQNYLSIIQSKGLTDQKTSDWVEQLVNSTKQG